MYLLFEYDNGCGLTTSTNAMRSKAKTDIAFNDCVIYPKGGRFGTFEILFCSTHRDPNTPGCYSASYSNVYVGDGDKGCEGGSEDGAGAGHRYCHFFLS
jgi:hypothetical protein